VRPVVRLEDGSNFNHAPNIASDPRNLSFFAMLCRYSTFDTLRQGG
jgi:hypothetical protein